jgi:hypothetical protein
MSFARPPGTSVFRADGTMAVFLHRRKAKRGSRGRTTSPFVGNGAKQLRHNDRSLSGFGIDALLFGRVRDHATIQHFAFWLACGEVLRGWACSVSGDPDQGIASIDDGIRDYRATGSILITPCWLVLKAEALHLASRTSEALAAIAEAEAVAQRTEERESFAELHRLRGVFLANLGRDAVQIETSFRKSIRIAKEQKSVSLATRAEASYAEYQRQKGSGLGEHGFRLPLC